jgi:hypothetical protein
MLLACMEMRKRWLFTPAVSPDQRRVRGMASGWLLGVIDSGCIGSVVVAWWAAVRIQGAGGTTRRQMEAADPLALP